MRKRANQLYRLLGPLKVRREQYFDERNKIRWRNYLRKSFEIVSHWMDNNKHIFEES